MQMKRAVTSSAPGDTRPLRKWMGGVVLGAMLAGSIASCSPKGSTGTPTASPAAGSIAPPPTFVCENLAPEAVYARTTRVKPYPLTVDRKGSYTVTLKTSCGSMQIKMFAKEAPNAVNNFLNLLIDGYYLGQVFYSIDEEGGLLAAGDAACPTSVEFCGIGGPGYALPTEAGDGIVAKPGSLAMDLEESGTTAGSRFLIALDETGASELEGHTVFGQLIGSHSLEVARLIGTMPTQPNPRDPSGPATFPNGEWVYLLEHKIALKR